MDSEGFEAAKVGDEQLHESVQDVCLVKVSDSGIDQAMAGVGDRSESGNRINRDHEQNPDDVLLKFKLVVVEQMPQDHDPANQTGDNGAGVDQLNGAHRV